MRNLIVFLQGRLFRTIPLDRSAIVFGRGGDSDVVLDHPSVSRTHARIFDVDGRWHVIDEGSTNGIKVNGRVIIKASLNHGDQIEVGVFTVHFQDEGKGAPRPVDTARVEAAYTKLQSLFVLSSNFTSLVNFAELMEKMIDCLLDIFQAERGFVLLHDQKSGKLKPAISRRIESADTGSISFTVAQKVAQSRQPMLITDIDAVTQLRLAQSIQRGDIRSIICTPLVHEKKLVGILYLDSQVRARAYGPDDLKLLESFAQHATHIIENAVEKDQLRRDVLALKAIQKTQSVESDDFSAIIGRSESIRRIIQQAQAVARQDVTTLILGESGTGKELLAKAIHAASRRRDRPFVAVNCLALARDVIESELFGHERGAFTGAVDRRVGRFELADGGTIFLDEIGELPQDLQAKLLRVLQERQIERVGSTKPIDIDVRLLCATNIDLDAAVPAGKFREDLYYRINVMSLRLSPLRERRDDVPLLVDHFVHAFNRQMGRALQGVAPDALQALVNYHWPGNIRELRNVMERAFVLETGSRIGLDSLPFNLLKAAGAPRVEVAEPPRTTYPKQFTRAREVFERMFIQDALGRNKGNITATASDIGLPRKTLYRKMELLKIDVGELTQAQEISEQHQILESLKKHRGNITAVSNELGIPRTSIYRKLTSYGIDVKDFQ
ncbi:MAG: sigma 54-interacting transcriptional regulator [Candidatus Riflebacteria bacterium]|nr:sigma 54-interacting transcriptional regulator [Candidatus Riflebacteria bacterium]